MTITRRTPESSLVPLRDVFDRWFRDPFFSPLGSWVGEATGPSLDMREEGDNYVVEAELPGVRPEDVEVTLDGRTLTFRGSYGEEREQERGTYLIRERRSGTFTRSIMLPMEIDADNVESESRNGELKIILPKAPQNRARRIEVRSGQGQSGRQIGTSSQTGTSSQMGAKPQTGRSY